MVYVPRGTRRIVWDLRAAVRCSRQVLEANPRPCSLLFAPPNKILFSFGSFLEILLHAGLIIKMKTKNQPVVVVTATALFDWKVLMRKWCPGHEKKIWCRLIFLGILTFWVCMIHAGCIYMCIPKSENLSFACLSMPARHIMQHNGFGCQATKKQTPWRSPNLQLCLVKHVVVSSIRAVREPPILA